MKNFGALVQGVGKPNRLEVSGGQNTQDGPKNPAISRGPKKILLYIRVKQPQLPIQ